MSQRFGDIGDVRSGTLQYGGERMPGRVGGNVPDAECLADSSHTDVYGSGCCNCFGFALKDILISVKNWENKIIRVRCISPAVDNGLHLFDDDYVYFFSGFGCVFGLLPHKTDFAVTMSRYLNRTKSATLIPLHK